MSNIFKCESCGNADSITTTHQTGPGYTCQRCKDGTWHNFFPEESYSFEQHGPALNVADPESGLNTSFS